MAKPIRVGLIGLSASHSGTGWANSAHLPFLKRSPDFRITALCNSSVEAAQSAVQAYGLPPETKTYGSPEDLANDEDVDLVIANTRVDKHAEVALPSIRKGKDVFCEWPLDRNLEVAKQMRDAAREGGGRTVVGAQGAMEPYVRKLKSLIDEGKIGRVLSSTFVGAVNAGGSDQSLALKYFLDRKVGGNILTIGFGHSINFITYVLGDIKTFSSLLATQIPDTPVVDRNTNETVEIFKKDTPDQIMLQAQLKTGPVLSYHVRADSPSPANPALTWRIFGTKGEIELVSPTVYQNVGSDDTKITLYERSTGEVNEIAVDKDEFDDLPRPARNIARLYEAFRNRKTDGVDDFESALQRHALIDEMLQRWDSGQQ